MYRLIRFFLLLIFGVTILVACSTEKNTTINRGYHALNARYNGNFNANELLKEAISNYRINLKENYYKVLPLQPYPSEEEVKNMYSPIDTAIAKCTKVIQKHAMPSNDNPSKKTAEYNSWIDENWITIGKANYIRRDYENAMKMFLFVKKFFSNDPSVYVSELWIAKINIANGKYAEAAFNFTVLDKALLDSQNREKEKKEEKLKEKVKDKTTKTKATSKKDEPAKFPKSILLDYWLTKADLALIRGEKKEAFQFLEEALKCAKKQSEKARINFILGQLYELENDRPLAVAYYSKVLKYNAPYEMIFNARIKRAFLGGDAKLYKDLHKMLRDAKNAEYKDVIYFALAGIEIQRGNIETGKDFYQKSTFYSTTNTRQKAMSYEKLGDLAYKEKDYVNAQKYYQECANLINDDYPNAAGIRNKAVKLSDLVLAVEAAYYEDSIQKVAKMNPNDREDFVKWVIKKTKEEQETKKKKEAERLRELQQIAAAKNAGSTSKWYFDNQKAKTEGFEDFKKNWGTRVNEDDWRRSDKIVLTMKPTSTSDSSKIGVTAQTSSSSVVEDTLTVDYLTNKLPLTDSLMQQSILRSMKNHYDAGMIYKDQLFENHIAIKEFNAVLSHDIRDQYDLLAAFQMYRIYEKSDTVKRDGYKEYILNHFPNSDYANFLRDPDFFIKKKELDAASEKEFLTYLDRYKRHIYYPVINKANTIIEGDKTNPYRAKYMLLKAMCIGQTNDNKAEMDPVLNQLLAEYPNSPEAARAKELLTIIKNGVSKNELVDFTKKSFYSYNDEVAQWVIIFLGPREVVSTAKNKVSDFNKEFYSKSNLRVSSKIYGTDQNIILVQEFPDDLKAMEYVRTFQNTKKHVGTIQKSEIYIITQENLKKLFESEKLVEYETFYEEHY